MPVADDINAILNTTARVVKKGNAVVGAVNQVGSDWDFVYGDDGRGLKGAELTGARQRMITSYARALTSTLPPVLRESADALIWLGEQVCKLPGACRGTATFTIDGIPSGEWCQRYDTFAKASSRYTRAKWREHVRTFCNIGLHDTERAQADAGGLLAVCDSSDWGIRKSMSGVLLRATGERVLGTGVVGGERLYYGIPFRSYPAWLPLECSLTLAVASMIGYARAALATPEAWVEIAARDPIQGVGYIGQPVETLSTELQRAYYDNAFAVLIAQAVVDPAGFKAKADALQGLRRGAGLRPTPSDSEIEQAFLRLRDATLTLVDPADNQSASWLIAAVVALTLSGLAVFATSTGAYVLLRRRRRKRRRRR